MKIPKSESSTVEFKTSFNQDTIVSLVAFANTNGGSVYIGIRDDGKVVGVQMSGESETTWVNEVKNKTAPSIVPDVERVVVSGRNIVRLHISAIPLKPASVQGRYYSRFEDGGTWFKTVLRKTSGNVSVQAGLPEKLPEKLPEDLGDKKVAILKAMVVDPTITISELMKALSVSHTSVKNNIAWLKGHGYVRRVGPDKGGHWEVVSAEASNEVCL